MQKRLSIFTNGTDGYTADLSNVYLGNVYIDARKNSQLHTIIGTINVEPDSNADDTFRTEIQNISGAFNDRQIEIAANINVKEGGKLWIKSSATNCGLDGLPISGDVTGGGKIYLDGSLGSNFRLTGDSLGFTGDWILKSINDSVIYSGDGISKNSLYGGSVTLEAATVHLENSQKLKNLSSIETTATITADSALTLTLETTEEKTYAGAITGNISLDKTGVGALTLNGNLSHTGTTTVSAGTLTLTPTNTLPSDLTVKENSTLYLTGTLGDGTDYNNLTLESGSNFSPGVASTVGMAIIGNFTLNGAMTMDVDNLGNADRLTVNGAFSSTDSAAVSFDLSLLAYTDDETTLDFGDWGIENTDTLNWRIIGDQWGAASSQLRLSDTGNVLLTLRASAHNEVPEPTTFVMMLLGFLGIFWYRKRQGK
ncbi:MAG: autotransporter-associated beta strand repeat-containing protein [Planctomycetia bacterium]|nr:autotransporter-associated beta strand repeat-containing protein [Planctomycetia bacterium]